jgi:hypothetical protein
MYLLAVTHCFVTEMYLSFAYTQAACLVWHAWSSSNLVAMVSRGEDLRAITKLPL